MDTTGTVADALVGPSFWGANYRWIVTLFVQALIAAAAIGAARYAGKAFKEARSTRQSDKESRHAYLAPAPVPGKVSFDIPRVEVIKLKISLVNYGINPLEKGNATVQIWSDSFRRRADYYFLDFINPTPHQGGWNIFLEDLNIERDNFKHIRMDVTYVDALLDKRRDKKREQSFFWSVHEDGRLVEPRLEIHERLKILEPPKSSK